MTGGETPDLGMLQSAAPVDALKQLILLRVQAIASQFDAFHRGNDGSKRLAPIVVRMYAPVNPLLLISAIALARVDFLATYARGLDVPGLEELISMEEAWTLEALETEDAHLEALMDLGVEELGKHGRVLGEEGEPNLLDVYWACWMVANPIYLQNELPVQKQLVRGENATEAERSRQWMRGFPRAVWWGMEHNSAIHNAREACEFRLNEANAALNEALQSGAQKALVASLVRRQKACTLLVERARRLYYWAPHEIEAYEMSYRVCMELAAQARSKGVADPWAADDSGFAEWVQPFLLPPHIRQRLNLPNLPNLP